MTEGEESERRDLLRKRDDLVLNKREHETALIAVKNLIRTSGMMPHDKYRQCCDSQATHARAILAIEGKLNPLNARIRELSDLAHSGRDNHSVLVVPPKDIVAELVALREEYQKFSADATRVSSMRQMAAAFALKLNAIIRRAVNGEP